MKNLHEIQINILRELLFSKSRRYSEIKPSDMEGSQFKFHLDKLISQNLVVKNKDGNYVLTIKGKEFANQMDSIDIMMRKQSKITSKICCIRNSGAETEYLLYNRKKQPFFNHQGFPTSKIWYGDSVIRGVKNGLFDETNLDGDPEIIAIRHYFVINKETGEILEDKTMYICKITNPKGDLKSQKDGEFEWVKSSEVEKFVTNPLLEFTEVFQLIKSDSEIEFYKEVKQFVNINQF